MAKNTPISLRAKVALAIAIIVWASAYVAIRAGLQGYSPGGLALFRYLIASLCMIPLYFQVPKTQQSSIQDKLKLLMVGVIGIGFYNLMVNYGEVTVTSSIASFIISQSPLITVIFAVIFLGERLNRNNILGFLLSILGVALLTLGQKGYMTLDASLLFIFLATLSGGLYTIMQKPFLNKYHAIEVTSFVIWGGTIALLFFLPDLFKEIQQATFTPTLVAIYLGVFPAAIGYMAWSYALSEISASRAVSFLYFTPFISTALGWLWLGETLVWLSIAGGALAVAGIWLASKSTNDLANS